MAELIKKFIVWYLLHRCNACFKYKGKVVRVFSEEFYNTEVREHLNAVARARYSR